MDKETIDRYKNQLLQVDQALLACSTQEQKDELITLKTNIEELLTLSDDTAVSSSSQDDEFRIFMDEMEKDGAVEKKTSLDTPQQNNSIPNISEGMKCRAPHKHMWGDVVYHDAMVAGVEKREGNSEPMAIVLFTHPTHREMLACPYYYEEKCKFDADKCRFSHGERVPLSEVQEYVEPAFDELEIGSYVLAKRTDNLWYKGKIMDVKGEKYFVRLESTNIDIEVLLEEVYPLPNGCADSSDNEDDNMDHNREDTINMSLLITPSTQALGAWETYTKGIGSKLMQKMGYIVGTGLGKRSEGRIEPVTAVVLPAGKSLDYCMQLREFSAGENNLRNKRKKLKRQQRRQNEREQKIYEENCKKDNNVFDFLNRTLGQKENTSYKQSQEAQQQIKKDSSRDLNVKSLQLATKINGVQEEMEKIKNCLRRNDDVSSDKYLKLKDVYSKRQDELNKCQALAQMISNEQKYRENKKKMSFF